MSQKHRLGEDGTDTTGSGKSGNYDEGMQTNNDGVAHRSIVPDDTNYDFGLN
jgi:hypothetical protein